MRNLGRYTLADMLTARSMKNVSVVLQQQEQLLSLFFI